MLCFENAIPSFNSQFYVKIQGQNNCYRLLRQNASTIQRWKYWNIFKDTVSSRDPKLVFIKTQTQEFLGGGKYDLLGKVKTSKQRAETKYSL